MAIDIKQMMVDSDRFRELVKRFFDMKLNRTRSMGPFKSEHKNFQKALWKNEVQYLTHTNLTSALSGPNGLNSTEEELLEYVLDNSEENLSKYGFNKKIKSYENIERYNDSSLPYYMEQNKNRFFKIHLSILKKNMGDDYESFYSKLLVEKIDDNTYTFPVVNLLDTKTTITINNKISSNSKSKTEVPPAYSKAIKQFMPNVTDDVTFTIEKLDLEAGIVNCSTSTYMKTLYTCDKWFYQMVTNYPGQNGDIESYKKAGFLLDWCKNIKDIVINNKFQQDSSIGCSCLCIYKHNNNYEYFIGQKTANSNGFLDMHVIPSLMFQPLGKNQFKYDQELSVKKQVLRELAEEIFCKDEYDTNIHSSHILDDILDTPQNKAILELIEKDQAEFHITGLWLDMYRLRPEITSVLIIKDENWFNTFFSSKTKIGNWEIEKGYLMDVEIGQGHYESILNGEAGNMCPPGIAALVSGLKKAKGGNQVLKQNC